MSFIYLLYDASKSVICITISKDFLVLYFIYLCMYSPISSSVSTHNNSINSYQSLSLPFDVMFYLFQMFCGSYGIHRSDHRWGAEEIPDVFFASGRGAEDRKIDGGEEKDGGLKTNASQEMNKE